jgi:hypothetical protein
MHRRAVLMVGLTAVVLTAAHGAAARGLDDPFFGDMAEGRAVETRLYATVEYFVWKEFSGGMKLLEESGPLYGIGLARDYARGTVTFRPRVEAFGGTVDYDGATWGGTPIASDTGYIGVRVEGDVGRIFSAGDDFALEPFGGIGYSYWERDLESTAVSIGYRERWSSAYARLGVRAGSGIRPASPSRVFGTIGMIWPFASRNTAELPGIGDTKVEPKGRPSLFAEAGFAYRALSVSLFYRGMRFDESDPVPVIPLGDDMFLAVFQPESEADAFGLQAGVRF